MTDNLSSDDRAGPSVLQRLRADWLTWLETSKIYRLLRITESIGIILAVIALIYDFSGRQESRVVASWQLLTTRAPGNSGKVQALENLNRAGIVLVGLDLSPPQPDQPGVYLVGVRLASADLSESNFSGADISGGDFRQANLTKAKLSNVRGQQVLMTRALLEDADLSGSSFDHAKMDHIGVAKDFILKTKIAVGHTTFQQTDFSDSFLTLDGPDLLLRDSNVSGACLYGIGNGNFATKAEAGSVGQVWALNSHPAKGLPDGVAYFECEKDPTVLGGSWREHLDMAGCTPKEAKVARNDHCTAE